MAAVPGAGTVDAPAAPVLAVPAASRPVLGPADRPPDGSAFTPILPRGTPAAESTRDPAAPITDLSSAIERAYWTNPQLLAERARSRSPVTPACCP